MNTSILLTCNGNEGFPSMVNIHNTPLVTNENSQLLSDHYHSCTLLFQPRLCSSLLHHYVVKMLELLLILVFTVPVNKYYITTSRLILTFR